MECPDHGRSTRPSIYKSRKRAFTKRGWRERERLDNLSFNAKTYPSPNCPELEPCQGEQGHTSPIKGKHDSGSRACHLSRRSNEMTKEFQGSTKEGCWPLSSICITQKLVVAWLTSIPSFATQISFPTTHVNSKTYTVQQSPSLDLIHISAPTLFSIDTCPLEQPSP